MDKMDETRHPDSAPASARSAVRCRRYRFLCLALILYTLITAAGTLVGFRIGIADDPRGGLSAGERFLYACPLTLTAFLSGFFLDSDVLFFALSIALSLLPLVGWFLANAGKTPGFLLIRSCMIAQHVCWIPVMMVGVTALVIDSGLLIPLVLGFLIPLLTLLALRAWQDNTSRSQWR